ncbi:MAG: hypothetical protein FJX72_19225, partial [Armatimonadetes bacterium]|nr:hypothetical protein [Armatimonadota bacterium]
MTGSAGYTRRTRPAYTPGGQALSRDGPASYADAKRVTFQYDAGGRRTTMVDWDGTTTYS